MDEGQVGGGVYESGDPLRDILERTLFHSTEVFRVVNLVSTCGPSISSIHRREVGNSFLGPVVTCDFGLTPSDSPVLVPTLIPRGPR